jgi:hypothetical protein
VVAVPFGFWVTWLVAPVSPVVSMARNCWTSEAPEDPCRLLPPCCDCDPEAALLAPPVISASSCCVLRVFACAATSASSALNCEAAVAVLPFVLCPPVDEPVPVEPAAALVDPEVEDPAAEADDPVVEDPSAEEPVLAPDETELLVAGVVNVTVELSAKVMVVDDEPSALVVLWVVAPASAEFSRPARLSELAPLALPPVEAFAFRDVPPPVPPQPAPVVEPDPPCAKWW